MIKVTIDGIEFHVKQKDGYVLIDKRPDRPFARSQRWWDSRKDTMTVGSLPARVLAKASRRATLTLSKGNKGG